MNTIHSTFNNEEACYTVVGGQQYRGRCGLSAVLLNRGGKYLRRQVFERLDKIGFDQIISIENPRETYDVEDLSASFPFIKFLMLTQERSMGEQINIAAAELSGSHFFVVWNDTSLSSSTDATRLMERYARQPFLAQVPAIQNSRYESVPSVSSPAFIKGRLITVPNLTAHDGQDCLYPYDGIALYEKDAFIRLGGFDPTILSPYWQLLDFGFRARLWGQKICVAQWIKLQYDGEHEVEDQTVDEGAKLFYLKNLAPVVKQEEGRLPLRMFFRYAMRAKVNPIEAWKEFALGRNWVQQNRSRFLLDARELVESWEKKPT